MISVIRLLQTDDEEEMEHNEVCIEADDAGDDLPVADV